MCKFKSHSASQYLLMNALLAYECQYHITNNKQDVGYTGKPFWPVISLGLHTYFTTILTTVHS